MQKNNTCDIPSIPTHSAGIKILVGEEVFDILSDRVFQTGWDELYSVCEWGTVFQSRAFVTAWYNVFNKQYLPILVKCEEQGRLTGLLTMALHHTVPDNVRPQTVKGRIVGAGQYEAEYQTWLAEHHNGEEFIKTALEHITISFPRCDIHFRYIPSQAPLNWVQTDPEWHKRVLLYAAHRPLMDLHSPDLAKLFRKGEFRNKLNRLKRQGELIFEHVKDIAVFSAILPELVEQYDFRQGAMFNKNQFRDNPLKADFLLAMFEHNLLHVTVLKLSGDIIAAIVAVAGKGWVHLGGINVHTPFGADYYSPGFVQFLLLGQHLAHEGYDVFDLTPGGDSYKERMANGHDQVYELVVASRLSYKMKRQLRNYIFARLENAGVRPMSVELISKKKLYLSKWKIKAFFRSILSFPIQTTKRIVISKRSMIYSVGVRDFGLSTNGIAIRVNSLGDLLAYDQSGSSRTRWEFLEEAMRRLERGHSSYTWSEQGRLLACAWLRATVRPGTGETCTPDMEPMLEGLYCHHSVTARLDDFILKLSGCVGREAKQVKVNFHVPSSENELCRSLLTLSVMSELGLVAEESGNLPKLIQPKEGNLG